MIEIKGIKIYTDKEVRVFNEDTLKFVKVGNEYRFAVLEDVYFHSDMVLESEKQYVQSAGTIGVWSDCWVISMVDAPTLHTKMVVDDISALNELIGSECFNKEEL